MSSYCVCLFYALINILYFIQYYLLILSKDGMKLLYNQLTVSLTWNPFPQAFTIKIISMKTSSTCHKGWRWKEKHLISALVFRKIPIFLVYPLAHNFHLYSHTES